MIRLIISTAVLGGITIALIGLYLLPLLLPWTRRVPDVGPIAVINVLLGWTLAGWVIALALALRSSEPPNTAIQLVQRLPPSPLPPGESRPGWPVQPGRQPAAAPPLLLPLPEEPDFPAEGDDQQW